MAYDNTNTGILFINDRKEKDSHPDRTGNINIEGVDYFLDGWLKKTKDGKPFLSLSVKRKNKQGGQQQTEQQPATQQRPAAHSPPSGQQQQEERPQRTRQELPQRPERRTQPPPQRRAPAPDPDLDAPRDDIPF